MGLKCLVHFIPHKKYPQNKLKDIKPLSLNIVIFTPTKFNRSTYKTTFTNGYHQKLP